jgi:hypothetical protein
MPGLSDSYPRRLFAAASSKGIQLRALATSTVIGSALTLINQGDAIFAGHTPDLIKTLLTYFVPYCVATYAGSSALIARQ